MLRRMVLCTMAAMVVATASDTASAVEVDGDLKRALSEKDGAKVRVLMVFDESPSVGRDLLFDLQGTPADQRRKRVLKALKLKIKKSQTNAMAMLNDLAQGGTIGDIRSLYLAGAISFAADARAVAMLSDLPDRATLFHDRNYDLIRADRPASAPAFGKTAATVVDTVWNVKYINAHRVWDELGYTGNGVVVGHIDTGVWLSHPDLAGGMWRNPGEIANNGLDDDGNGFVDDVHGWDFGDGDADPNDDSATGGHGTHTAGTVIGDGTGGTLTGVAPDASLMVCKVWQASGAGGSLGMIWAAEQYCVENGARVITMSLGFPGGIPAAFMRADRVNCNNIRDAGVTLFNSSGNDHFVATPPLELGLTARVPAPWSAVPVPHSSTSGVITVGGTGYKDDTMYVFSSRGPAKWDDVDPWRDWPFDPGPGLIKPDVALPGVNVNSTIVGGGYSGDTWSGTSMSCPHAAGIAALMLERNPSLSPAGLDSIMELNAIDLGAPGKDTDYGSGRLDAFTVVAAVPATLRPDLIALAPLPDPAGDSILDPGEASPIAFELKNVSPVVQATGVLGTLAVAPNPYVTVVDADGSFADLAAVGGADANLADTFTLNIAAAAPHGYRFTMLLTVTASGGFERTYDIPWNVGLPDWRTHDLGGVYLTVTDQGIIGYLSQDGTEGRGMGYRDGPSGLFVGSFWAGTDLAYVCARDYGGLGTDNYEWVVSDTEPNGRVLELGGDKADQAYQSVYTDAGHAEPRQLQVRQTSLAFADAGENQFVIMEYELVNQGAVDLGDLHAGVYCDFDVVDSGSNEGGTDASRNLSYLYNAGGPYYGVALLGGASAANLTMVNNPEHVYQFSSVPDQTKIALLRGAISVPTTTGPADWSVLASAPVPLTAEGGRDTLAFALVYGATLTEMLANTDAARTAYDPAAPIDPRVPVKVVHLAQNQPNPFNPSTEITFALPRAGRATIAVYDVSGRRIRTLLDEIRAEGPHSVSWDGVTDDGVKAPSGTYFYRLKTESEEASRKMTLVK